MKIIAHNMLAFFLLLQALGGVCCCDKNKTIDSKPIEKTLQGFALGMKYDEFVATLSRDLPSFSPICVVDAVETTQFKDRANCIHVTRGRIRNDQGAIVPWSAIKKTPEIGEKGVVELRTHFGKSCRIRAIDGELFSISIERSIDNPDGYLKARVVELASKYGRFKTISIDSGGDVFMWNDGRIEYRVVAPPFSNSVIEGVSYKSTGSKRCVYEPSEKRD